MNKVAADLEAEHSNIKANGAINGTAHNGAVNGAADRSLELSGTDADLLTRVERLEKSLSQQEAFMKRMASAIQDVWGTNQSDLS